MLEIKLNEYFQTCNTKFDLTHLQFYELAMNMIYIEREVRLKKNIQPHKVSVNGEFVH